MNVSEKELREFLKDRLPSHLIPLRIESVSAFPATPNGKVDRVALAGAGKGHAFIAKESINTVESGASSDSDKLLEVWKKVLGRSDIGRSDNFFDMGGHSLSAAQLIAAVKEAFGVKLSIADLFKTPIFSEFSKRIEQEPSKHLLKSLVVLKKGLPGKNVFFVHGPLGHLYGYLSLVKSYPSDRTIYGLQGIGVDRKELFQGSFEEIAKIYVDEIFEAQPEGPYHLLGYSLGGWIAYAVAQEIRSRGKEVGCLALLDTQISMGLPWYHRLPHTLERYGRKGLRHIRVLKSTPSGRRMRYIGERWKSLKVRFLGAGVSHSVRKDSDEHIEKEKHLPSFEEVGAHYLPSAFYGDMDLFVCEGSRNYRYWFWKFLVKGEVRIHQTQGNHYQAIDETHAPDFALAFEDVLKSAESREQGTKASNAR
ncbi:MAG: thioesterase domain-containing protein [Opitutaceae bacterium]